MSEPYVNDPDFTLYVGDVREVLAGMTDESVDCCVTSPPYWGLRDYGVDGQLGLEATPEEYVAAMVEVFREVRRVLGSDGTCWLNLGDSYASNPKKGGSGTPNGRNNRGENYARPGLGDLKAKDLAGIPWRVARALQEPYYTGKIKDERDRIWLAAMIDAEGCIYIHKRKAGTDSHAKFTRKDGTTTSYARTQDTYGSGLEISNTSRAVVERVLAIVGGGSISTSTRGRNQPLHRWTLRTSECRDVLREVYPHLVAKQHQARLAIGCPSSGESAAAAHSSLISLHNGHAAVTDFPSPESLFEPGWYLRSDIIWSKSNPMPESVTDRPTKTHEYVFLLTKSARYFYDADAIAEPATWYGPNGQQKSGPHAGQMHGRAKKKGPTWEERKAAGARRANRDPANVDAAEVHMPGQSHTLGDGLTRNARSVWTIQTQQYADGHFAVFPEELPRRCIAAGCPAGGIVLDPFMGSGTTALVARKLERRSIGIELNQTYADLAARRLGQQSLLTPSAPCGNVPPTEGDVDK